MNEVGLRPSRFRVVMEIGGYAERGEHLCRGEAREDAATSTSHRSAFGSRAFVVAPEFIRQLLNPGRAPGLVRQPGIPRRLWPKDNGARLHQFGDSLEHLRRDMILGGQHEQPVAHAIGQDDASVGHGHPVQDHVAIDDIIVIARVESGVAGLSWHIVEQGPEIRGLIAVIGADIGDEMPLLQDVGCHMVAKGRGPWCNG